MKIFFYCNYIATILNDENPPVSIGGADVQLALLAREFAKKDDVYTFSIKKPSHYKEHSGIHHLYFPIVRKMMWLLGNFRPLLLLRVKPDVLVIRSVPEKLWLIKLLKKKLHFKILYMLASDLDVNPNKEERDLIIDETIMNSEYVVAQNQYQYDNASSLFGVKKMVILPNVWSQDLSPQPEEQSIYDYIWVGNLRPVKRPEWIADIARSNPDKTFAIVGADLCGYNKLISEFNQLSNVSYLGNKTLFQTSRLIGQSKCLFCTSIKEGFPNTFLQAFSYGVPVISTVDPSNIITNHKLGYKVETEEELSNLIKNDAINVIDRKNVMDYLNKYHSCQSGVNLLRSLMGV